MALEVVTVHGRMEWKDEEPDGSPCSVCGDQCLLRMVKMYINIPKIAMDMETRSVLCSSCYDASMRHGQ